MWDAATSSACALKPAAVCVRPRLPALITARSFVSIDGQRSVEHKRRLRRALPLERRLTLTRRLSEHAQVHGVVARRGGGLVKDRCLPRLPCAELGLRGVERRRTQARRGSELWASRGTEAWRRGGGQPPESRQARTREGQRRREAAEALRGGGSRRSDRKRRRWESRGDRGASRGESECGP
eukprot:3672522-Prymnesium_polylepis.1